MAQMYDILKPENKYWDKNNFTSIEGYITALQISTTVYVGNLSFYTQQNSIKELFQRTGSVKDIIMGIDNDGNPCGFCFVVYETRNYAQLAVEYISKTRLGGRIIRVDWDPGYIKGREKGRGSSGQQRREDFRNRQDPERPRKQIVMNNQSTTSSYRNDSYRDRGDNYRNRGDRNDNNRGGQRRDFKPRQYRNDRSQRPDRGDRSGGDRGERGQRFQRGDRGDRSQRFQRGDRSQRFQRGDRGQRGFRGQHMERGDRNQRGNRGQRGERQYERQPAQNKVSRQHQEPTYKKQQQQY